jgi:glycosyltransferase involved in cell wall biosynthesis
MRVGVNARRLSGQRLGIGRYIEYIAKYWDTMLGPSDRVTLYVQEPLVEHPLRLSEAFTVRPLQPKLTGSVWENVLLPSRAGEMDVLFGPSYTLPLAYPGRTVVATHSINEVDSGSHPWWYKVTYTPWYRLSAQKADRVIVPSNSTKVDIQAYYGIPAEKIDVVAEGVDDAFQPHDDEERKRKTRIQFTGTDRPYILFVGKASQRRNIPTLMRAFSLLKKRHKIPHTLLLVGPNVLNLRLPQLAEELGIADCFVQTDGRFETHAPLIDIYNAADLYAYPSTYDGFSLTTVEAMACGVPVIAMNKAALREIADGCAYTLDELNEETLADAAIRILTDVELYGRLRARGLERAKTLRWRNTARQTLDVLRKVAES